MSVPLCAPTYEAFSAHLKANRPALLRITRAFHCAEQWRLAPDVPNWQHLAATYGDAEVTLWECRSGQQLDLSLREALQRMRNARSEDSTDSHPPLYYIKDWHLALHCEAIGSQPFYSTPGIFHDDWMNDFYLNQRNEDFRFVYAGSAGSFTGVHCDVYGSYSWSTNICGRKRWWLLPPEHAANLRRFRDVKTSETVSDFRHVDHSRFKNFREAEPHIIQVEQEPGQTIWVPSGWWHMVENLTECISINHNWCNSFNIERMYTALREHSQTVEAALEDVKDLMIKQNPTGWQLEFITVAQDVLRQDSGWDLCTFWLMIDHHLKRLHGDSPPPEPRWTCPANLRPRPVEVVSIIRRLVADFRGSAELVLQPVQAAFHAASSRLPD